MTKYDLWNKFLTLATNDKATPVTFTSEEIILFSRITGFDMIWDVDWAVNSEDGSLGGYLGFNTFDGDDAVEIYTNISFLELRKFFREV